MGYTGILLYYTQSHILSTYGILFWDSHQGELERAACNFAKPPVAIMTEENKPPKAVGGAKSLPSFFSLPCCWGSGFKVLGFSAYSEKGFSILRTDVVLAVRAAVTLIFSL